MYRFKGHCSKTGTPKDMVGARTSFKTATPVAD